MSRPWVLSVFLGGVLGLAHGSSAALIGSSYFDSQDQRIDFETAAQRTSTVGAGTPEQLTFFGEGSSTSPPWIGSAIPGPASNPTQVNGTILRGNMFVPENTGGPLPYENPTFSDIGIRFLNPRAAWGVDLLQITTQTPGIPSNLFDQPYAVPAVEIEVLGLNGTPLEHATVQIGPQFTFFGYEDTRGITEILIAGGNMGLFAIDNLLVGEVIEGGGDGPEPGASVLILLGLATFGLGRRALQTDRGLRYSSQ